MQETIAEMVRTHPGKPMADSGRLVECIRACDECKESCTACADACLAEDDPKMLARCIRLNADCADICDVTSGILSRQLSPTPDLISSLLEACGVACRECATECEKHQDMHEHCRICAEACRRCEQACQTLASTLPARSVGGH